MSTALIDRTSLIINGQTAKTKHVDLYAAICAPIQMTETVKGASSVLIQLKDPHRTILNSGVIMAKSTAVLDGALFELSAVSKSGTTISLTFEDAAVAALRTKTGLRKAAKGTVTRAQFCTALIREVPWIKVESAPGATAQVQLARGSGSSDAKESTWDAITRIMGEIQWRVACVRGTILMGPDSWFISRGSARYTLSETSPGIDNIDLDWNIGKPAATATLTVWAGKSSLAAGSPVTLERMGAGNGGYLVETIVRTETSRSATVTAIRPLPTLPEPKNSKTTTDLTADQGNGGYVAPSTESPTSPAQSAKAEAFVQAALAEKGKPYVWGASGPNTFDCSGLVQYAAGKVGVTVHKPVQSIYDHIASQGGYIISVDKAIRTRGAVLIRLTGGDHIAISLGNGQTMEAHGKATGCGIYPATGRVWTHGAIIPGIEVTPKVTQNGRQGEGVN